MFDNGFGIPNFVALSPTCLKAPQKRGPAWKPTQ